MPSNGRKFQLKPQGKNAIIISNTRCACHRLSTGQPVPDIFASGRQIERNPVPQEAIECGAVLCGEALCGAAKLWRPRYTAVSKGTAVEAILYGRKRRYCGRVWPKAKSGSNAFENIETPLHFVTREVCVIIKSRADGDHLQAAEIAAKTAQSAAAIILQQ